LTISAAHGESRIFDGLISLGGASLVKATEIGAGSSRGEFNAAGDSPVAGIPGAATDEDVTGRLGSFCAKPSDEQVIIRTKPAIQFAASGVFIVTSSSCCLDLPAAYIRMDSSQSPGIQG
jgi:hypothetical protein